MTKVVAPKTGKGSVVRKAVRTPAKRVVKPVVRKARQVAATAPVFTRRQGFLGRYLITPTDVLVLLWRGIKFAWRNKLRVAIVVITVAIARYGFHAGAEGLLFSGFLAVTFAWDLDGRVSIGAGLVCLVLIVVLQALIQSGVLLLFDESTEAVAVWAYYFLCIGVVKQLVDLVREGRRTPSVSSLRSDPPSSRKE